MAEVCPGHHLRCRMEVWLQEKMYKSPVIEDQPTQTNQPNSTYTALTLGHAKETPSGDTEVCTR